MALSKAKPYIHVFTIFLILNKKENNDEYGGVTFTPSLLHKFAPMGHHRVCAV